MGRFLYTIYNIISPLLFVLAAFLAFFSSRHPLKDTIKAFKQRLFPEKFTFSSKPLWFHAASLGELKGLSKILTILSKNSPDTPILITTSTLSGLNYAGKFSPHSAILPADFPWLIKKFLKTVKPLKLIITETELWPNLIKESTKTSEVLIINARISDKTFSNYKKIKPLLKFFLKDVSHILAQSKKDAERFKEFFSEEKISISGNLKYDLDRENEKTDERFKILSVLNKKKIVFGSTHREEEEIILSAFETLKKENTETLFIIVPRHIGKISPKLKAMAEEKKEALFFSKLKASENIENKNILIVDEMGLLYSFYSICDIAFVGGTLDDTGGHNLLEPADFSKPILFGPNYKNALEAATALLNHKAAFIVKDSYELKARIKILLSDPALTKKTGENAFQALNSLKGATSKTVEKIINAV